MANPKKTPNIILINCDDLGYGDLGCYGSKRNSTPHLDRLAEGGLRLTDFYMASSVCSASRAAMLTGCYPQRIGFGEFHVLFPGNAQGLSQDETTIARQLKTVGYATKIIGKWHCGDQPEFLPTSHGFDEYFGIPFSNDMGRQVNHPERPPLPLMRDQTVIQQQPDQRGLTERYTDEAMQFIHRNKDTPFFLYLAHMHVHVPIFVARQFLEKSKNGAYGGAVECIDWSTGAIVETLKKLGLFENTLIIFTSDNGSRARDEGGSNLPCRGTKGTSWEGGQRLPCILHWPDGIEAGRTSSQVVRSIDFLPTLSRIAGVADLPERPIDGVDASEHLLGKSETVPNETMAYYHQNNLEAIRVGDWKLHFRKRENESIELYHLSEDISEEHDLVDSHPEIVERLNAVADAIRARLGDDALGIPGNERRPIGTVENPKTLTTYDESHPYMIASYDLPDMPTLSG